ncbi:RNA 2',3'-cyclic phosphodiesterase [Gracilibacillus sp. S3-1-1]|uniref:RNA 2',3'-cyclic phosphodiesterase n=1 Tax=Gracilibacillus pellucidus TaxID=3095368 RepID=A0ACC6M938_9BACI|nr:RNA 2',3'-cyclic phosphodiesterase [Gracilibacillus sp. S3-1-1]MDX8047469.1 RNA 2',3'-cyclic phosphodiesterase [Gracilibacillus sp. S3-1-1]
MNQKQKHYFIAIELDAKTKKWLYDNQQAIKHHFHFKNWVEEEDFHITLHFFGAVESSLLHTIGEELKQLTNQSFPLKLVGLSTFGLANKPRVLWVGVEKTPLLIQLHADIIQIVERYVPIDKRPFRPHITLGKKWSSDHPLTDLDILHYPTGEHLTNVNSIVIYEIHPDKQQKYQVWRHYQLK